MLNIAIQNIINGIVEQYGDDIYLDSSRLLSLSEDRLRENYPEAFERIKLGIYANVPKELYYLKSDDEHKQLIGMKRIWGELIKNFSETTAYEIINCFVDALGMKSLLTLDDYICPQTKLVNPKTQHINPHELIKSNDLDSVRRRIVKYQGYSTFA